MLNLADRLEALVILAGMAVVYFFGLYKLVTMLAGLGSRLSRRHPGKECRG